jgi:hypothetical protein
MWRSRSVVFAIIGCLTLLILSSFEGMHVLAQPTPTPSERQQLSLLKQQIWDDTSKN